MRAIAIPSGVMCLCGALLTAQSPSPVGLKEPLQPDGHTSQTAARGPKMRISLDVRDSTRLWAIKTIAQRARLKPTFIGGTIALDTRVRTTIVDMTALDAVREVLKGSGLDARLASDRVTLMIRPVIDGKSKERQDTVGSVSGVVMDSTTKNALSGVTVAVQGTPRSVLTNQKGEFELQDVPVGHQVLTARLVGYKGASRSIDVVENKRLSLRITLSVTATALSGVVTTATGQERRVAVGNDITTINVDSVMRTAPINTVTDLLDGRVPGLTVARTTGSPGAPSRMRLRGASSMTGSNDPIVIVDGARIYAEQSTLRNTYGNGYNTASPIDQIDVNSIETIEVFKGPSASALYGSDAANGVVVITTKRGRSGPTRWSVAMDLGMELPSGKWPVNYYRFGSGIGSGSTAPFCAWDDVTCRLDSVVAFQALNDSRYTSFDRGIDQNLSATVSGGVAALTYAMTGSVTQSTGIFNAPCDRRATVRKILRTDATLDEAAGPVSDMGAVWNH